MSDAWKMMRLDILSMKVYLKNYLIILIYPVIFSWWSPSVLAVVCCMMFAVMASSVFSVQEKNHLDRLYGVVHLSKRSIVLGRYLFAGVNLLCALVFSIPLHVIISRLSGNPIDPAVVVASYGTGFLFFWLLSGIQMPIFFRLGYTRARMWSYLPFLLVVLVPVLISLFPGLEDSAAVRGVVNLLSGAETHPLSFLLFCVCAGLVLLFGSLILSTALYRRRQP